MRDNLSMRIFYLSWITKRKVVGADLLAVLCSLLPISIWKSGSGFSVIDILWIGHRPIQAAVSFFQWKFSTLLKTRLSHTVVFPPPLPLRAASLLWLPSLHKVEKEKRLGCNMFLCSNFLAALDVGKFCSVTFCVHLLQDQWGVVRRCFARSWSWAWWCVWWLRRGLV